MEISKLKDFGIPPLREFLIDGLIYKGEISLLYGESGAGKSALIVDMFSRAVAGKTVDGRQTVELDVFWLPTENLQEHQRRLLVTDKSIGGLSENKGIHYIAREYVKLVGDTAPSKMTSLAGKLRQEFSGRPQVVIIDTLNQAMPGMDENSSVGMSEVVSNLKILQEAIPELHILIVHHSGKKKENGARGHSSLEAAMDSCFFLSKKDKTHQLEVTKQRGGNREGKIKFHLTPLQAKIEDREFSSIGVEYL